MDSGRKPFRYFPIWKESTKYDGIVEAVWNSSIHGSPMYSVVQKLKKLKIEFKQLNREGFGDLQVADRRAQENMLIC